VCLVVYHGLTFLMRKGRRCKIKVRSVYLLVIQNISKVTNFFNLIVMKFLLEEMLNLMKISWSASLIRCLYFLWPTSHFFMFVPSSFPTLFSPSSDDYSEDKNPPLPTHFPPDESIELEHASTPLLPIWVRSR
jgi:hypothetical protein